MAWGKYLAGHFEVRGRAARGGRRRREKAVGVGRHGGEDTADKRGPLDRETRERRPAREGANQKGKCISREDATDHRTSLATTSATPVMLENIESGNKRMNDCPSKVLRIHTTNSVDG
jgi:hypothetical protein